MRAEVESDISDERPRAVIPPKHAVHSVSAMDGTAVRRAEPLARLARQQYLDGQEMLARLSLMRLIGDVAGRPAAQVAINRDIYSLNSLNGVVTLTDGTRFFFKFHAEEGEDETLARRRDKSLEAVGIRVMRIAAADILSDIDAVLQRITAGMRRMRGRSRNGISPTSACCK